MLDSSNGSEYVIVVAEEKMKGVEKPHTQVSPAQVCVGIYQKHIFHDNNEVWKVDRACVGKMIAEFVKGTLLIAEAIRQEFEPRLDH